MRVDGFVAAGFEQVRSAFEDAFAEKPDMGAALAIRHHGKVVADLWGGFSDERSDAAWQEGTLSVIFSCTKGLVSILAARLVQEGRLDYLAPVSSYWPEFEAAGKSDVTVRDLLAHRSGLSAPREPIDFEQLGDWNAVTAQLAAQEPLWRPGTGHAYHAITHGWLVGEVIRRITGKTVGQYFSELIATPLGVEAWIGLPAEENGRVAHLQVGSTLAQLVAQDAAARRPGIIDWRHQATTLGGALPADLASGDRGMHTPSLWSAEIPGAGGIATARALATIWSATIVDTDGVRLLEDRVVDNATLPQSEGATVWNDPGPWTRWGMGFQLDSESRRYLTARGFGHDGAGGQSAFADPGAGVGFAFLTNQMEAIDDVRATHIIDALRLVLVRQ